MVDTIELKKGRATGEILLEVLRTALEGVMQEWTVASKKATVPGPGYLCDRKLLPILGCMYER